MDAERWSRIEELYHQGRALGDAARAEYLAHTCAGDPALLAEVQSLLDEDARGDAFLEEPALAVAAQLVAGDIPVLAGRAFGPYEIGALIGAGGMGDVYRARDTVLGRDVAIKFLPEAFTGDPDRLSRFEQEAQFLASLSHPHIAAIYGMHADDGLRGLVLELVEGETLAERIKRGPVPLHDALRIARQIGLALDAAHQRGIVHCDLKPSNIKVDRDGTTKVLDFGLAISSVGDVANHDRTRVIGTASYMSPEQARGDYVDKRTDIWGFGCVCFEMLTGTPAYSRNRPEGAHPDWGLMPSTIPGEAIVVLKRCLDEDLTRRRRDIGDVLVDLEDAILRPARSDPPHRSPQTAATAGAVSVVVATAAFFLGWAVSARPPGTSVSRDFPTWRKLTFNEGYIQQARFGPGGETILYSASWEGKPFQLFTTNAQEALPKAMDVPPGGLLAVSRSGQLAVGLSCLFRPSNGGCIGTLARVPHLGGAPQSILENVQAADWGPQDTLAAIVDGRLEYPPGTRLAERAENVRVSPDGRRLATVEPEPDGLAVVVRLGSEAQVLSRGWTFISGLAWAADGSAVFVSGIGPDNNDDAVSRIALDGTARLVLRSSSRLRVLDAAAADRLLIDHASNARRAWLLDSRVPGGRKDLTWLGSSVVDALSGDGSKMLLTVRIGPTLEGGQRPGALYPIYVRPTDGGPAVFLGNGYGRAFSADGRWALTVTRNVTGGGRDSSLIVYPLGPGSVRTLDRGELDMRGRATNASFAGSGRVVFDAAARDGLIRTYVQSIDGGLPALVEHEPGQVVSPVAPDGERFISRRPDGSLWMATLQPRASARLPFQVQPNQVIRQWTDDGRQVFVLTLHHDRWVLTRVDVETGLSIRHAEVMRDRLAERPGPDLRVSRDGRTIVYSDSRLLSSLFLIEGAR
jgi:serine/threonine protein kinase